MPPLPSRRCRRLAHPDARNGNWQQNRATCTGSHVATPHPDTLLLLSLCAGLAAAFALWLLHVRVTRRVARRRAAGYQLMDCLKAYTAWIDWHRDEPLLHQNPEELSIPAVLAQAVQIKDQYFPQLSPLVVQLLHTHGELMQYLWEQNILRMTHSEGMRPYYADPQYHQLRDRQDAALDSLFLRCRESIGDTPVQWRSTRSDFNFSSGMGMPSRPSGS
jgi:hypothetical protein